MEKIKIVVLYLFLIAFSGERLCAQIYDAGRIVYTVSTDQQRQAQNEQQRQHNEALREANGNEQAERQRILNQRNLNKVSNPPNVADNIKNPNPNITEYIVNYGNRYFDILKDASSDISYPSLSPLMNSPTARFLNVGFKSFEIFSIIVKIKNGDNASALNHSLCLILAPYGPYGIGGSIACTIVVTSYDLYLESLKETNAPKEKPY